jgi:hypothetical protein
MNRPSAVISLTFDARRANLPRTIVVVILLSFLLGFFLTNSTDEMLAYMLVTLACAVPVIIWIQLGVAGIPVISTFAVITFVYYAVPIIRHSIGVLQYGPSEILGAAGTVALFMGVATISWWLLLILGARRSPGIAPEIATGPQLERLMFIGLAFGAGFHVALYSGWLELLGPSLGLVRALMLTAAMAACFVLGHARAKGSLRGQKWILALVCLSIMVILSWASLLLVVGMTFCLAAVFGYVITSRRVPWVTISAAMAVLIVFHAGKEQMRAKYWFANSNYGAISLIQVPAVMVDWAETGITNITSSNETYSYTSIIDRASLLELLMRVQRLAPDYIPFLEGKSYSYLPEMLVPRFLDPNKTASQAGMILLNVTFGIESVENTRSTAVGWGLIAEAYANFGMLGVIGVGILLGLFCGSLERWSAGAPLVSLPCLVTIVVMMQLINPEADLAGLVTTLVQSVTAIAVVYWCLRTLSKPKNRVRGRFKEET